MRGASAIALAAVAVLVAAQPLAAQQRRVLHGEVTLADDSVLADAAVRFVYVARGGEAHDATDDVTVRVLGSNGFVSPWSWPAIPDQTGRVSVATTSDDWIVFASDATSAAVTRVAKQPTSPVRLVLQPLPAVRGRVVDRVGKPVAGAQLELADSRYRKTPREGLDEGLDRIAMFRNADAVARCSTRADGTFECAFVLAPGIDETVRFRHGDRTSGAFPLEPADGVLVEMR